MSKPLHFLYVEDDETSRTVMEFLLPYWGEEYELTLFSDSHNFMERVLALPTKPDVIFLDIHITPYSGFEMLELLRTHNGYHDITIIALTASVMSDEINKLKTVGFNGAIAKPLNRLLFSQLLNRIINGEDVWNTN